MENKFAAKTLTILEAAATESEHQAWEAKGASKALQALLEKLSLLCPTCGNQAWSTKDHESHLESHLKPHPNT